jgi:hypothetical protein
MAGARVWFGDLRRSFYTLPPPLSAFKKNKIKRRNYNELNFLYSLIHAVFRLTIWREQVDKTKTP